MPKVLHRCGIMLESQGRVLASKRFMPSVLVVDDNESVRQAVFDCFTQCKYEVFQAADAKQGVEQALAKKPSAIIMDLNLPGQSGFEAVEILKKNPTTSGIPILVFTAHHRDGQLIESREHGADGYLIKGGPWEEVVGYIDLLIRSIAKPGMESLSLGPVTAGLGDRTVRVDGRLTPALTPKEFDLLVFLMHKSPVVVSWERVSKAVWGETAKYGRDSKTIELHAQRVRRKLGPEVAKCILTHRGFGLQFLPSQPVSR